MNFRVKNPGQYLSDRRNLIFGCVDLLFHQTLIRSSLKCFLYILIMSLVKWKRLQKLQVTVRTLPVDFVRHVMSQLTTRKSEHLYDISRIICVPQKLALKYGIRNYSWIALQQANGKKKFPCRTVVLPHDFITAFSYYEYGSSYTERLACVFVAPQTVFNIQSSFRIQRRFPELSRIMLVPLILTEGPDHHVPLGLDIISSKTLKVSNISSVDAVVNFDQVLKSYFESERYFTVGDIFSVVDAQEREVLIQVGSIEPIPTTDCSKIRLYSASTWKTSVYLGDNQKNSFRPIIFQKYVRGGNLGNIVPTCVPCLEKYVNSLSDWMDSYTQFSSTLKSDDNASELWPTALLSGPVGCGKYSICKELAQRRGINLLSINVANLVGDTSAFTIAKLTTGVIQRAKTLAPCIVFLKNVDLLGKDKDGQQDKRVITAFIELLTELNKSHVKDENEVFVVGATRCPDEIVRSIADSFIHQTPIEAFKANSDIHQYFRWKSYENPSLRYCFNVDEWLSRSGANNALKYVGDVGAFFSLAIRHAQIRLLKSVSKRSSDLVPGFSPASLGNRLEIEDVDFDTSFAQIEIDLRNAVGSPKVPLVTWDDVGGLAEVKRELVNSVQLPLQFPHLFTSGLKRSGMLLYGPPGTGKTLLAKAVASEFKINFLSVKGPELLNMYVGQSEQNVRDVFQNARAHSPCVLFFDELDSLAPNRGKSGDSGGVMDRVVSQILAELDGTHSTPNVFIIGATNRPDLIDPALLRPGRFDKLIYVGVSADSSTAGSILKALSRKFKLSDDVDFEQIASQLPPGMSGADLYALCSEAFMTAISNRIELIETGEADVETPVIVRQSDFLASIVSITPSLTSQELDKYRQLKSLMR